MAKLFGPIPGRRIIGALRLEGLDFYLWKGIQVVRAWPQKPKQPNNPVQQAWKAEFKAASEAYTQLDPETRATLRAEAAKRGYSGRALFLQRWLLNAKGCGRLTE